MLRSVSMLFGLNPEPWPSTVARATKEANSDPTPPKPEKPPMHRGVMLGSIMSFISVAAAAISFPFMQTRRDALGCDALCQGGQTSLRSGLMLVGASLIGRSSDQFGRKPMLMIGLVASLSSLAISASMDTILGMWIAIVPTALLNHNWSVLKALFADYVAEQACCPHAHPRTHAHTHPLTLARSILSRILPLPLTDSAAAADPDPDSDPGPDLTRAAAMPTVRARWASWVWPSAFRLWRGHCWAPLSSRATKRPSSCRWGARRTCNGGATFTYAAPSQPIAGLLGRWVGLAPGALRSSDVCRRRLPGPESEAHPSTRLLGARPSPPTLHT